MVMGICVSGETCVYRKHLRQQFPDVVASAIYNCLTWDIPNLNRGYKFHIHLNKHVLCDTSEMQILCNSYFNKRWQIKTLHIVGWIFGVHDMQLNIKLIQSPLGSIL